MTLTTIAILVIVVVLAVWLLGKDNPPGPNEPLTPELLRACLEMLLYRGLNEAQFDIRVRDDPRSITLTKYVRPGAAGIRARILRRDSTVAHYDQIRDELERRGIKFSEVTSSERGSDELLLDYGQDIGQWQFVLLLVFEQVLRLNVERDCVGYFNTRVLPVDRLESTGVARPSEK